MARYTGLSQDQVEDSTGSPVDVRAQKAEAATHKRHLLAGLALAASLLTFTIQTESASQIAARGFRQPVFMLFVTHSSWWALYPLEILFEWAVRRNRPLPAFARRSITQQAAIATQVAELNGWTGPAAKKEPWRYVAITATKLALALNVAGLTWYVAVNLTTAADLTAIFNCSALFVYAFSIPLLHEQWNPTKGAAVVLSIAGVLVVAYGGGSEGGDVAHEYPHRLAGNVIVGLGAVLYGLYDVLYKKIACPPQAVSAKKQALFATVIGSALGVANFAILLSFIVICHLTGWESFVFPPANVRWLVLLSIVSNIGFMGSFLTLMSLTSPVLGSVSSLLTTFIVPLVDYVLYGHTIGFWGLFGGLVIIVAFAAMAWASWREMQEDGSDDESIVSAA